MVYLIPLQLFTFSKFKSILKLFFIPINIWNDSKLMLSFRGTGPERNKGQKISEANAEKISSRKHNIFRFFSPEFSNIVDQKWRMWFIPSLDWNYFCFATPQSMLFALLFVFFWNAPWRRNVMPISKKARKILCVKARKSWVLPSGCLPFFPFFT